jgi:hypothetical protein
MNVLFATPLVNDTIFCEYLVIDEIYCATMFYCLRNISHAWCIFKTNDNNVYIVAGLTFNLHVISVAYSKKSSKRE